MLENTGQTETKVPNTLAIVAVRAVVEQAKKYQEQVREVVERQRAERVALYAKHEDALAQQLDGLGIRYVRQVALGTWRWDFGMIPPTRSDPVVVLDIQGSTRAGHKGRHTSHAGYTEDTEKWAAAQMFGYRILIVTGEQVDSGRALQMIEAVLTGRMSEETE